MSAIYNVANGDIIQLDCDMTMILRFTEEGLTIKEAASRLSKKPSFVQARLERLEASALGKFYRARVYIEKCKEGRPARGQALMRSPVIARLVIELPFECGLGCLFCQYPKMNACTTCSKAKTGSSHRSDLYAILSRLLNVECTSLVFRGGDPLTQPGELTALIRHCRERGFNGQIFVVTNGTHIDTTAIDLFLRYQVHPVIPFAWGIAGLISETALRRVAQVLGENRIQFTLTALGSCSEPRNEDELSQLVTELGPANVLRATVVDHLTPSSWGSRQGVGERQILRVSSPIFYHNSEYHPCLHGTLAISADGRILPCPFLGDETLAAIDDPLVVDKVFGAGAIDKYWRLGLSQIEYCKDCALRYGCLDCRALEKCLTSNLYGKQVCPLNNIPHPHTVP